MIVPKTEETGIILDYLIATVTVVYVWAFSGVTIRGDKDTAGEITKSN